MSAVENLINEFKSLQQGNTRIELLCNDGGKVCTTFEELSKCPYFKNVLEEDKEATSFELKATERQVHYFIEYLRHKSLPDGTSIFHMGFASTFCWKELNRDILRKVIRDRIKLEFDKIIDMGSVMGMVEILMTLPLRTFQHYSPLIQAVKTWAPSDDHFSKVIDTIVSKLQGVQGVLLDVPLLQGSMIVAIMENMENKKCVMVAPEDTDQDTEWKWKEHDIFGPNFSLSRYEVLNFHLVFGDHIVFIDKAGRVYVKDIQLNIEPVLIPNVKFFTSKRGTLIVICEEENEVKQKVDIVYKWCDSSRKFEELYRPKDLKLRLIIIDARNELTFVTINNVFTRAKLENSELTFTSSETSVNFVKYIEGDRWEWKNGAYSCNHKATDEMLASLSGIYFCDHPIGIKELPDKVYQSLKLMPVRKSKAFVKHQSTLHGKVYKMTDVQLV